MKKILFILTTLDDEDIDWFAQTGERAWIAAGDSIVIEGASVGALFIILDGEMAVTIHKVGEVNRIGVGEVVGELSFIDGRPPAASVTALRDCLVLRLPRERLERRLEDDSRFAARFYKALAIFMSDRLRGTVRRLGFGDSDDISDDEMQNELSSDSLNSAAIAGARFDRIIKKLTRIGDSPHLEH